MQEGHSEENVETSHMTVVGAADVHRTIARIFVRHRRIFPTTYRNGPFYIFLRWDFICCYLGVSADYPPMLQTHPRHVLVSRRSLLLVYIQLASSMVQTPTSSS